MNEYPSENEFRVKIQSTPF